MRSPRTHAELIHEDYPHFITAVTKDRQPIFSDDACAKFLMTEFHYYSELYKTDLIAAVIMPDHFHVIIYPQTEEHTFSDYMHGVKGYFARWYGEEKGGRDNKNEIGGATTPRYAVKSSTPKIWQDSFFDYVITSEHKLEEKILYIMENPVEDGLTARPEDYPYLFVHEEYRVY